MRAHKLRFSKGSIGELNAIQREYYMIGSGAAISCIAMSITQIGALSATTSTSIKCQITIREAFICDGYISQLLVI